MLSVSHLDLFYGDAQALADVSLEIKEKEIVAIIGANGAGKTSLIRAIAGIQPSRSGRVLYKDEDITNQPSNRVCNLGIGQVAEGRQVFPTLSIRENLEVGALLRGRGATRSAHSTKSSPCSRGWPSAARSSPARSPAASSRCLPSAAA